MSQSDHVYDSMSYAQIIKKHRRYLTRKLKGIEDFLQEATNLEELYVRTALIKVPDYMSVIVNGEYYYFKNGTWYEDEIPF